MRRLLVGMICSWFVATAASAQDIHYTWFGENPVDQFGSSTSSAGDVNGDGHDDVLIGAPFSDTNGNDAGTVYVYSGIDGTILRELHGASPGDLFGAGVAFTGDLDGDGVFDAVIGAPQTVTTLLGYVQVYSGATGALLHTIHGTRPFEQLGAYVSGLSDMNNDGRAEFAAGGPAFIGDVVPSIGTVVVGNGLDGSILYDFRGDDFGGFGYYMRDAGDVDQDGVNDLIVGAPFDSTVFARAGMARIFSGVDGSTIHTIRGANPFDHLGASVGGMGDVNDDGFDDVLIGSYGSDIAGPDFGAAWVYSGKDATILYEFLGDSPEENFGFTSSGLDDINGDGYRDAAVGALWDDEHGCMAGSARMYSGRTGNLLYEIHGHLPMDRLGRSVKSAGDVNDDGFFDVSLGAYFSNSGGVMAGKALVLAGDDLFVNASPKRPAAGDTLSIQTGEGTPGLATLLVTVEINGVPMFRPEFGVGVFDSNGVREIAGVVPGGFSGLSLKLKGFALSPSGVLIDSGTESLLFR